VFLVLKKAQRLERYAGFVFADLSTGGTLSFLLSFSNKTFVSSDLLCSGNNAMGGRRGGERGRMLLAACYWTMRAQRAQEGTAPGRCAYYENETAELSI
jgi:hypothetical protein